MKASVGGGEVNSHSREEEKSRRTKARRFCSGCAKKLAASGVALLGGKTPGSGSEKFTNVQTSNVVESRYAEDTKADET